jgi:hypothetical protein
VTYYRAFEKYITKSYSSVTGTGPIIINRETAMHFFTLSSARTCLIQHVFEIERHGFLLLASRVGLLVWLAERIAEVANQILVAKSAMRETPWGSPFKPRL